MNKLTMFSLCLVFCGCATVRQTALDISLEEVENRDTAREVAANYLSIWPMQSGFIKGALGPRMDELPGQAIEAINELDRLAEAQNQEGNQYSDYDLGLSLGLRVRLLCDIVQEALKMYTPDVIEYIPLIF